MSRFSVLGTTYHKLYCTV